MKICDHCGCIIPPEKFHMPKGEQYDGKRRCYSLSDLVHREKRPDAAEIERQLQQQRSDRGEPSTAL